MTWRVLTENYIKIASLIFEKKKKHQQQQQKPEAILLTLS